MGFKRRILFGLLVSVNFAQAAPDVIYTVKAGDTLLDVSIFFYCSESKWREIARFNKIKRPYILRVDDKVKIQNPTYSEKEGRLCMLRKWQNRLHPELSGSLPESLVPENTPNYIEPSKEKNVKEATLEIRNSVKEMIDLHNQENKEPDKYRKAVENLDSNSDESSLKLFNESIADDPKNFKVWIQKIKLLKKMDKNDEAEETKNLFLEAHPQFKSLPFLGE